MKQNRSTEPARQSRIARRYREQKQAQKWLRLFDAHFHMQGEHMRKKEQDVTLPDATAEEVAGNGEGKRKHRATYATDKRAGGYLVRVAGPYPERFAGRTVPVVTKSGTEHMEKLTRLIWTGADAETGEKVSLYKFEPHPREEVDLPF